MPEDLRDLLAAKTLGDLVSAFEAEGVEAGMLADLTDDDLREIGLNLGQRKRFRAAFPLRDTTAKRRLVPAERRQLTVVFCDLVGSTKLATELDPEDLRAVITTYLDTAVETARAHGGYLAYTQGDGLMIYFGYPVAEEDDPVRAIRAALATVAAVKALKTQAPAPLEVRLGVATGRVVVGDMTTASAAPKDFVVGETPNLAARLQSLAEPGEVIVAGATKALAGGAFSFEERGYAVIKGFDEPRAYFAAISETTGLTRFETRLADGVQPIVGREAELQRLGALWRETLEGRGRTCVVLGAPGIGKSRLLRAFYAEAGRAVIEWQCAPHLTNRALHPMAAELERASGILRSDEVATRRDKLEGLIAATETLKPADLPPLASLVGAALEDEVALDAQTRSRLTTDALLRRVRGAAAKPALVILEDAHWADPATLDFLDLLARSIEDRPVFLVITSRNEFGQGETLSLPGERLSLAPLDAAAGLALVRAIGADRTVPPKLARLIIEKTDGVPLFVEELTKSILDGVSDNAELTPAALQEMDIPATLQDSLMARLDRLGPAKETAQLGSVIGREFTAAMVRAVAPPESEVDLHLERLEASGLLHREGLLGPEYYVFNHALVQDTAYESILKSSRQEFHLKFARAMLAGQEAFAAQEPEIVARHAELGGLAREAMEHWSLAGQQALSRAANPAAVTHFEAALRCLAKLPATAERDGLELQLQMSLAPAAMATFGWASGEVKAACQRAIDLAQRLGQHEALYGATWGLWTNYFLRGEMDAALSTADQVETMARASGSPVLLITADHARGYSHFFRADFDKALDHAEAGLARADFEAERAIVGMFQFSSSVAMHSFASASHWMLGHEEKSDLALAEALALSEKLGHAPSLAFALAFSQYTQIYRQNWTGIRKTATRVARLAEEEGFMIWAPQAEVFHGLCDCHEGDLKRGLARIRRNYDRFAATGTVLTRMQMMAFLATELIRNGEIPEAIERLKAMIADTERRTERVHLPELYRVLGEAHYAAGNRHQGLANLKSAFRIAKSQGALPLIARAEASLARFTEPRLCG